MKHLGTIPLETRRLLLRPFTVSDAQAMFYHWASDKMVTKYLTWPAHRSPSDTAAVLERWVESYQDMDYYHWAITLKDREGELIGSIGVTNRIDKIVQMAHIGYCIGRDWWHQGITSEALKRVMSFLFEDIGLQRIESRHDPRNPNSGLVMKKCGMRYEGTLRCADWNNEGICDACYYGMLAGEWRTAAKKEVTAR